jgi:hypothetical protein
MRVAPCNGARAEYGLKYGLNRLATLHLVEVLILTPNSWKAEYAKTPLAFRAADGRQRKPAVMKRSGTMIEEASGKMIRFQTTWTPS